MSRIDEALRRAAEDEMKSVQARHTRTTPPAGPEEVTALSREPFPAEVHGVRAARSNVTPIEPVRAVRVIAEQKETRQETPSAPASLFERLDARLAEKVVVDHNMSPASREQYRRLAATLHDAQGTSDLRVIMVASALPGEGKTLTASNLALTLSESYRRRVLLVDADLRKPMLHQLFQLNTTSGLTDGLNAPTDVKLVLRQVSSQLWVLPAGRPTSDPMAGLTSERMRRVLEEAKQTFDWIIIDTPPLLALADAHLLSSLVDAAVLVVKANSTPHDMVNRAAEVIGRNRVIGVVLNQAGEGRHGGYAGYYAGQYLRAVDHGTQS